MKQLLDVVAKHESENVHLKTELTQVRAEWDEFRTQVALKTDLEAQRDQVLREEVNRLIQVEDDMLQYKQDWEETKRL